MTAARLKDILYYSAVSALLCSPFPSLSLLFSLSVVNGGKKRGQRMLWKSLGHGLRVRRSAEDREKTTDRVEERVRSDGKARAARKRRGVNHDFGGILARNGMRFPPSSFFPSFVHSFAAMLAFPFSCLSLSLPPASFLSRVPRLVRPPYVSN